MKFIKALGRIIKKIVKRTIGIVRKAIVFAALAILAALERLGGIENIVCLISKAFIVISGVLSIYDILSLTDTVSIVQVIGVCVIVAMITAEIACINYISNKIKELTRFYEERKASSKATISED